MAVSRPQPTTPGTPKAQLMKTPTTPPGAPAKSRSEQLPTNPPSQIIGAAATPPRAPVKARPQNAARTPPSQITRTSFSPLGAPDGSDYGNRLPVYSESRKHNISPTESYMINFLSIPPFSAPQIQCILWLSWITTATPTQIAKMHNRVFADSPHKMSRWNVVDIENSVATNWHERGGSFGGMNRLSLLVPPGSDNPWSCLCGFGVENCYDYKRDQKSGENLEKLSMARMLWDATPKELVRCPHGRRRHLDQESKLQRSKTEQTSVMAYLPGLLLAGLVLLLATLLVIFKEETIRMADNLISSFCLASSYLGETVIRLGQEIEL